jgi:DNA polymerase
MAQLGLFHGGPAAILAAPDYAAFAARLRASGCTGCPLHAGRTQLVVDRGNPAARLLVVGEAPGADEDAQGRAFVGRAGQLLDRLMAEVGLDTERDMLIANVVKCRPPDNRAPTPAEAAACLPYLRRQLALVDPAVVALLGATALRHLAPGTPRGGRMGDAVGRFLDLPAWPGRPFLVLYHPAALLYNRRLEPAMRAHLAALRGWMDAAGLHPGTARR